jgi:hypothetical protein
MGEDGFDIGARLSELMDSVIASAPALLGALVIFIVGWIVAVVAASLVRKLLDKTTLDDKLGAFLGGKDKDALPIDRWIATAVKWLILLFTITLVIDKLGMQEATEPLNALLSKVTGYLPNLLGAAVLMFIGWLIARVVRFAVEKGLGSVGVDDKLNKATGEETEDVALSKTIGTAAYWLILLLFLVMALDKLELSGLVEPLQNMLDKGMQFLPNLLSAAVIGVVGWFLATIIRRVLTSVLAAVGVDKLAEKVGLSGVGKGSLSDLLGTVAFLLVLLNVLSAALDALNLDAVSRPVSGLLATFYDAIPGLLYAALILVVAVFVGRLVSGLVSDLLARVGFDRVFLTIGISKADPESIEESKRPSAVAGKLVLLAVILFASMEALRQLGLENVSQLVEEFILLAGNWVFGLLIFGLGLWLANLVAGIVRDRGTPSSSMLATAAKVGISVLAAIAALERMGVAEDVVQWAAVVSIGAIGLGCALAFGLGCQNQASDQMNRWRGEIQRKRDES